MVKGKSIIIPVLIIIFLVFSFYPTFYEISQKDKLVDQTREFILEHNFYWPDFNLYLSKIRQGYEGRWTALERYTSEPHQGSLIQEFYLILGQIGKVLKIEPNYAYQLGRIILSPLLLIIIYKFCKYFFPHYSWTLLAFIIVIISGSFPRFFTVNGVTQVGRYMEWWSNVDALQRITFIPHILFGQVVSLFLLYQLTIKLYSKIAIKQLIFSIFLGNLAGLVFPPSLITLDGTLILILIVRSIKSRKNLIIGLLLARRLGLRSHFGEGGSLGEGGVNWVIGLFIIFTLPSFLYFMILTKQIPWSALVEAHRLHPMMIPLDQYILACGPVIILAVMGALISIKGRQQHFRPLIFWIISTLLFASFFSVVKEQSPLRFTQTGLFIPLGILATYFLQYFFIKMNRLSFLRYLSYLFIILYLLENLFIMKTSVDWQISFINRRVSANRPPVPYPPQTVYPLKMWMDGIRWLRDNTKPDDVILAEITAANFIPAYAGNTVYFGQTNTVAYELKQAQVDEFFRGSLTRAQADLLIRQGRINFVFYSFQEKDKAGWIDLTTLYPFLKPVYNNSQVTIYKI